MNQEFSDDGRQFSAQIHLRIATLLVILEEIEAQRKLLRVEQGKFLSKDSLEKLLDLMDRAENSLHDLERDTQKSL